MPHHHPNRAEQASKMPLQHAIGANGELQRIKRLAVKISIDGLQLQA